MLDNVSRYIDNELSENELLDFKEELKGNNALASEIALHKEINESIKDDEAYFLRKKVAVLIRRSSNKQKFIKITSGIAAGMIILFSIYVFNQHSDFDNAYNDFYSPYATDITTRSSEAELEGLDFAIKLYSKGEYNTALELLLRYNQTNAENSTAQYYLGLSAIETNNLDVAEKNFKKIINNGEYALSLHANWYLSMIYLKTDRRNEAKQILEELAKSKNFYKKSSREILRKYF